MFREWVKVRRARDCDISPAKHVLRTYRVVQKKGTVLLSTSLAWPAVADCSRAETFSQLSAISFAQPCSCIICRRRCLALSLSFCGAVYTLACHPYLQSFNESKLKIVHWMERFPQKAIVKGPLFLITVAETRKTFASQFPQVF